MDHTPHDYAISNVVEKSWRVERCAACAIIVTSTQAAASYQLIKLRLF